MNAINLTNERGASIRINTDHIVAYGPQSDGSDGSEIVLSNQPADRCVAVKETADEIDKLLAEVV